MKATKREFAIMQAFTGLTFLNGENWDYFMEYVKEKYGREIFTGELVKLATDLKEKSREDFENLCQNIEIEE